MDICSKPIKPDFKNAESGYRWFCDSCHPWYAYPLCWKQEDTEDVENHITNFKTTLLNRLFYLCCV